MPARKPPTKATPKGGLPPWLIITAIVAVAVVAVIVGADFLMKLQPTPTAPVATNVVASGRTQGDPNAPVSFVEYSDFQ